MGNAHEVLSYTVSADDKASTVFRGVGAEITKLSQIAERGLGGLSREMTMLGGKKPLEFVKADQALMLARTEAEMVKLQKTTAAAGVATKLQAAEMGSLTQRHKAAQAAIDATAASHTRAAKAATLASYGVLGAGVAVVAGAVKQGIAWEDLTKQIEQQTGLQGRALSGLMGTIHNTMGKVPYTLGEVSQASVILKTRFHETNPQIEKTSGVMAAFAKRANEEVGPAVVGLSNIMHDYRAPLGEVVGLTDKLVGISQLTQQPLGAMESTLERFGPKLQAMGYSLEGSVRLMGILGESGVKAEQMGRGLSAAYGAAEKALGGKEGPTVALSKEGDKLQKDREHVEQLARAIPMTTAAQAKQSSEVKQANIVLTEQERKYETLTKAVREAGGAHATVGGMVKAEIVQIEKAKTQQEAYSIAANAFGRMVGPAFARAFYNNKDAVEKVDKVLKQHGETTKLMTAEEKTLHGAVIKLKEEWHSTEIVLSKDLVPALAGFLKLVGGGVTDIEKFVKGNASLAEALGAVATVGAAGFLARKPIIGAAKDIGGVVSKITGIGGSSGSAGVGEISGVRGTTLPGSLTNPIYTRQEGGAGGGLPGGRSSAEKTASEDTKGMLARFAEKHPYLAAGGQGAIAAAVGAAIPFASAAAAKAVAEALHPGIAKDHSLAEVQKSYLGGQRPLAGVDLSGSAAPRASGIGELDAKRYVENTKEEVEANKLLLSSTNRIQQAEEMLATMRQQGETHTAAYRSTLKQLAAAEGEHARGVEKLMSAAAHSTGEVHVQIEQQIAKLNGTLAANPNASTRASVLSNWQSLTSGIGDQVQTTVGVVSKGVGSINKQLLEEVKALNGGKVASLAEGGPPLAPGVEKALTGHATGGRVPGPVGPDNWTLVDPAGRPAAKVGGSELLIPNRHTEAEASVATKALYGVTLGQMVAGETRSHSGGFGQPRHAISRAAATGGRFVADPGTNFSAGKEPQIVADLEKLAAKEGWTIYGISGYRSPQHSLEVGGFANDPHTRGEAADIGVNSPTLASAAALTAAMLASVGLERPFYPASAHEINHVQLLGSGGAGGARQALSAAVMAKALAKIRTPKWTGPGGELGMIGKTVLSKLTKAANAKLDQSGGMGSLAGFHGGGSPTANEVLGRKMMLAAGWNAGEWPALQALWTQESGWNANSVNPSSGAYGIPQSLGHGHPYNLGDAPAQIAWGLNYIKGRYGSPSAAEAHERSFNWYEKGGRVGYAGAFEHGGVVTASSPTMAMFGEKGTETAVFLPHAGTGIRVGSSGLGETQGVNPDTGNIEYHTQEEWSQIRLQHSSQSRKEALYKKAHRGSKPSYEDLVTVDGLAAGLVTMPTKGTISLPGDMSKLTATVWAKVVAAIEKTLRTTTDDRVAIGITGKLSQEHGARAHALARKAIETSEKTIMSVLRNAPEERAVPAGNEALSSLKKLIADARRSGNVTLVAGLTKDLEVTYKTTASRIVKTAEGDLTEAPAADQRAVSQLQKLMETATAMGSKALTDMLLGDLSKVAQNWQRNIVNKSSKVEAHLTGQENLKIVNQSLAAISSKGIGASLPTAAADPDYLAAQKAAREGEIVELETERKALRAAEIKAHHDHNQKLVAALRAQMGEVDDAITGAKVDVAQLQIDYEKAVYEGILKTISEADEVFQTHISSIGIAGNIEEGQRHLAGTDIPGLEEAKTKQGGDLTPSQIRQAQYDYAQRNRREEEKEREEEAERNYDISILPQLSGADHQKMEKTIEEIAERLIQHKDAIYDNNKSLEKLTEATKENTKVLGGSVGFTFNGQQYLAGGNASQSSNSAADISVGI